MPQVLEAGWWGLVAGSALLIGALVGYALRVPRLLIASVMAFGAGVLLSAVSFELVGEAYGLAGPAPAVIGTAGGAVAYTAGNVVLARRGARHRKRSGHHRLQPSEAEQAGSGRALALGALLDGVPESAVIGVGLLEGGAVGLVTVTAVFLSNLPEGLSSAAGMREAGRGKGYVFGVWGTITAASTVSAVLGYTVVGGLSTAVVAAVMAVAAGAILAMIADTMIPEAFDRAHLAIGLILVCGFLVSFTLSHI
ncbi:MULTISPECIES: ZIP family metal transporter [Streptomyces]|uniref:ZIP family zinc transporter n=2 Tax=Streptomyces TaxID=1883 RepID=A0A3R7LMC0_9ACTN|nr:MULTISPECIES: ZIP family zinc transporter [Streptomyces]KNE80101.1 ZIP family zinc transporter [Streptomyces fradiae]OFA47363.1 ZIP family zinc transporter [Streptomyces fradiae]PQM21778.1 ZIP family zinc transporter [Streptomyces xinghaiensis]RKM93211.1 ZIP family zinc transporter [Streptomyces xinghaiensis]RNC71191.1 ZIP family zinc transporter [Streptomyces xinghaiensis]